MRTYLTVRVTPYLQPYDALGMLLRVALTLARAKRALNKAPAGG